MGKAASLALVPGSVETGALSELEITAIFRITALSTHSPERARKWGIADTLLTAAFSTDQSLKIKFSLEWAVL